MSWVFDSTTFSSPITLAIDPKTLTYKATADVKDYRIPGGYPLLISFSNKPFVLSIEGIFYNAVSYASTLDTVYIKPFFGALYKVVTITDPNGGYFSGDWIFTSFEVSEGDGYPNRFKYKMEFIKGTDDAGGTPGVVI